MTYQTPIEPTLGQVMKRISLVRKDLAKKLANTPQREWDAQPVREMCNHEKELHTALMVLRDLAGDQGAFAKGAPEMPAAVAGPSSDLALIIDALENGQPQLAHYAEPRERHANALAAARRLLAAAPALETSTTTGA